MTPDKVDTWVTFMRARGIKRLVVSGLELELGSVPSSSNGPLNPVEPQGVFEDATGSVCACGHSWVTEHSDAGCLHGCSHGLCSSSPGAPDAG